MIIFQCCVSDSVMINLNMYLYFLREWDTFIRRLTVFVLSSRWFNHFRRVISLTIYVVLVLFWNINFQIRHQHTWIFLWLFVISRWVWNFSETGPIEFTNIWIWSSHVRAAAAPAARGTKTGGCGQDKESAAWFMAAHSGPEYLKWNITATSFVDSVEIPPLWRRGFFFFNYYCFCSFFQTSCWNIINLWQPYCPGRGCFDAFMVLYPSLSS